MDDQFITLLWYGRQVPRVASADVRIALVEHAAEMLASREPVTVRALAQRAGTSTMAVYTHFGGLTGLWQAVRQEGFHRLAQRLAGVERTADPVRDLAALTSAYLGNGLSNPALYRAMFDAVVDLEDPAVADRSFAELVDCATRARGAGRLADAVDPLTVATQLWASGHGLLMLALTGVLRPGTLDTQAQAIAIALCVAAGDSDTRCRRSITAGWTALDDPGA